MADLTPTASSVLCSDIAKARRGTAGATIAQGDVLYEDTADAKKLKLADSNSGSAGALPRAFKGIALNGAAAGQPVNYIAEDDDFTPGDTLVVGESYYVSNTAGKLCPKADLAAGSTVTFVGVAKSATKLRLKPAAGGEVPA